MSRLPSASAEKKQKPHRFKPGESGNPAGKKPGTRNKATMAAQVLLDGEAEALTRKVVTLALAGNLAALRLCLERICPPRKERPVNVNLPVVAEAGDLPRLTSAILEAVGNGELEPGQAAALASLVANHGKALELAELEKRIAALEEKK